MNTFSKPFRLSVKSEIERLHKKGAYLKAEGFAFRFLKNDLPYGRLLIAAPKRFCKLSVSRNRFKRLTREVFRTHSALVSGYDIKISITGKVVGSGPSFNNIQKAITLVAKRFNKSC